MNGNLTWLFAAFAIAWAIVFGYLFRLSRHERRLRTRVEALEDLLSSK